MNSFLKAEQELFEKEFTSDNNGSCVLRETDEDGLSDFQRVKSFLSASHNRLLKHLEEMRKRPITDSEIEDIPFGAQSKERYIGYNQALQDLLTFLRGDSPLLSNTMCEHQILGRLCLICTNGG